MVVPHQADQPMELEFLRPEDMPQIDRPKLLRKGFSQYLMLTQDPGSEVPLFLIELRFPANSKTAKGE